MRYDIPVYFQTVQRGAYDAETGNYLPDNTTEEKRWASVTNSSAETLQLVYGKIKQGSLTVQFQRHYSKPFDSIRISGKTYQVDHVQTLRNKQMFVVSEAP